MTATTPAPAPEAPAAHSGGDSIGAWLDRLVRITRLPAGEAREIRDELDAHLRERVRDLMLVGHDEAEAIHKAISELGDLAQLAHRYREAGKASTGRILMNIALFATVGAALGLGALAVSQPETPARDPAAANPPGIVAEQITIQPSDDGSLTYEIAPAGGGRLELVPTVTQLPLVGQLFINQAHRSDEPIGADIQDASLADVFELYASSQGLKPYIHWRILEDAIDTDEIVTGLPVAEQPLSRAVSMLNDQFGLAGDEAIDYRVDSGLLEIATRAFFDRRETELVTYDVSSLLQTDWPLETTDDSLVLIDLITQIVEPDAWPENGGTIAAAYVAGSKLFVKAPARIHERVAWLLEQLRDDGERHSLATPGRSTGSTRIRLAAEGDGVLLDLRRPDGSTQQIRAGEVSIDCTDLLAVRTSEGMSMESGHLGSTRNYTVREGDSLTRIAAEMLGDRRSIEAILELNPGLDDTRLEVGREISLPARPVEAGR